MIFNISMGLLAVLANLSYLIGCVLLTRTGRDVFRDILYEKVSDVADELITFIVFTVLAYGCLGLIASFLFAVSDTMYLHGFVFGLITLFLFGIGILKVVKKVVDSIEDEKS